MTRAPAIESETTDIGRFLGTEIETQGFAASRAVETNVDDYMRAFEEQRAYESVRDQFQKQAEPLLEMGVEVIIPAGGLPMLLFSKEKDFNIGGATVLNGITIAAKADEMAVQLRRLDGTSVSRSWFAKASPETIQEFLPSP